MNKETQTEMQTLKDRFFAFIKRNKKLEYGIYAVIIIIVLVLYFTGTSKSSNTKSEEAQSNIVSDTGTVSLEEKLTAALEKIDGAGKVEVVITYATSREIVPAFDEDVQQTENGSGVSSYSESSKPVTNDDGAVVLMEIEPQIRGVIVVAEGASDMTVKMNLLRAAQTALDVPSSKVEVFAMQVDQDQIGK